MLHKEESLISVYVVSKSFANHFGWTDKLDYLVGTEINLNLRSNHSQISQHEFVSHWRTICIQQVWVVHTKAWLFLLKKGLLLLKVLYFFIQIFILLLLILQHSLILFQAGNLIFNFFLHKILRWRF